MGFFSSIGKAIKGIAKGIGKVVRGVGRAIGKVAKGIGKGIKKVFGGKLGLIGGIALGFLMPYLAPTLAKGWAAFGSFAKGASGVPGAFLKGVHTLGSVAGKAYTSVTSKISDVFKSVGSSVKEGATSLVNGAKSAFGITPEPTGELVASEAFKSAYPEATLARSTTVDVPNFSLAPGSEATGQYNVIPEGLPSNVPAESLMGTNYTPPGTQEVISGSAIETSDMQKLRQSGMQGLLQDNPQQINMKPPYIPRSPGDYQDPYGADPGSSRGEGSEYWQVPGASENMNRILQNMSVQGRRALMQPLMGRRG